MRRSKENEPSTSEVLKLMHANGGVGTNGKEISSDFLPRIFDLGETTTKDRAINSGVGLAFVRMLVEGSEADIFCNSRTGDKNSYTEFIIDFLKKTKQIKKGKG